MKGTQPIGRWNCTYQGVGKLISLFLSIMKENVSIWLRKGNFEVPDPAIALLQLYRADVNVDHTTDVFRHHIDGIRSIKVLYKGIISVIGASANAALLFLQVVENTLLFINFKFGRYEEIMTSATAKKHGFIAPSDLENMIMHVGKTVVPLRPDILEDIRRRVISIEAAASVQDNSFMTTRVWAPNFPLRRPSSLKNFSNCDAKEKDMELGC